MIFPGSGGEAEERSCCCQGRCFFLGHWVILPWGNDLPSEVLCRCRQDLLKEAEGLENRTERSGERWGDVTYNFPSFPNALWRYQTGHDLLLFSAGETALQVDEGRLYKGKGRVPCFNVKKCSPGNKEEIYSLSKCAGRK